MHERIANITISQSQTGKTVENKPEWKATVKNDCICTLSFLKLNCNGFQTVEDVESSVTNLSFIYAWDTSFPFKPPSSQVICS
ncbi:TPD1 protein-like protein 1-like [Gossypium australe]|uniref:TPD1 protein-like protein 1-like n=1 Tax=Gossypium australe TaxID=47621 RepID=A0A5B6X6G4_9ROSI|nr:TPD1 protein-like protein 1-like [Gossypium australe]